LFFTTRLGRVKRTALGQFRSVRSTGLIAIGLEPEDELAWVRMTSGDDDLMLVSQEGQAARFREEVVRAMGRPAAGVIGIRLDPGDRVIASETVAPGKDLLVVSERGLGKRTRTDHFITKGRGGKGVTAMKLTTRTGKIVGAGMVDNEHALMLMSTSGKVIRLPVSQVPTIGRQTQGVTLMKLDPDETVATMTIVEKKDDEPDPSLPPLNGHDEAAAVPTRRSTRGGS
jgi:DNA gyrase subunit A